ncbi:hypothetical protein ABZ464_10160 [Streptomyces sp. NPDC005820]|uniref:hypothetical protein n=1 Tax=Streptomyces sp. NPDC005820 TaxID=3157069 RepID=UPI0033CD43C0
MREADTRAADHGADASGRLRAQANAFCAFASSFGEPGQKHPARVLWQQRVDAVHACEGEGLRWPDGAESAALLLWSALFGRFALWTSTFERHDQNELTTGDWPTESSAGLQPPVPSLRHG